METIRDSSWPRDSGGEKGEGAHVPPQALTPLLEGVAQAFRSKPFAPHALFRSGHAQTIAAALRLPRRRGLLDERQHGLAPRGRLRRGLAARARGRRRRLALD